MSRSLRADNKEVDVATNGLDGYKKASKHTYDAIVLDVMLPQKSGIDVCRDLRRDGITTPIIFLSARDSEVSRIKGLDAGADDYVVKPFSHKELNARLRAITRRPHASLHSVLQVGDVVLDVSRHVASRAGRTLKLRPKEFALLECLMRNPGRVMDRTTLLRLVWGIAPENSSNRLEVYIGHLRAKITLDGEKKLVHTIRGRGYKIDV